VGRGDALLRQIWRLFIFKMAAFHYLKCLKFRKFNGCDSLNPADRNGDC